MVIRHRSLTLPSRRPAKLRWHRINCIVRSSLLRASQHRTDRRRPHTVCLSSVSATDADAVYDCPQIKLPFLEGRGIPWLQRGSADTVKQIVTSSRHSTTDNVDMFTHIPHVYREANWCLNNRFATCPFLLVTYWYRVSIFNRFQDICIQIYLDVMNVQEYWPA